MGRYEPEAASSSIVRLARSVVKSSDPQLVILERIPPSDEGSVLRQARALRKMWEHGAFVIISINPEASQLLDLLPECQILGSKDLLVRSIADAPKDARASIIDGFSYGIPDLVSALDSLSEDDLLSESLPHAYGDALARQVGIALRRTLADGELSARLCMLLLGSGTLADMALVFDEPPHEAVVRIDAVAPFFRIDLARGSFTTLLTDSSLEIPSLLPQLAATCAMFPNIVAACLRVLLERGAFSRAMRLFSLPGSSGAYEHALRFGPSLLDVGGSAVLSSALDALPFSPDASSRLRAMTLATSALAGEEVGDFAGSSGLEDTGGREALLFVDARRLLQGNEALVGYSGDEWSELGRRLLVHIESVQLMVQGKPGAAMRLLVANPCGARIDTASSALLCLDFEAARLLLGESGGIDVERLGRAFALLESPPFRGLEGYARCVRALRAVLSPEGDVRRVELALSQSERDGDLLVQAVALVAGCVVDLRCGAYPRAGVRSALASVVAARASLDYLVRLARLFGDIARALMGDVPEEDVPRERRDELEEIRALALAVVRADCDARSAEDVLGARVPGDSIWLLLVLSESMGAFSGLFEKVMPTSWRCALLAARQGRCPSGAAASGARAAGRLPASHVFGESEAMRGTAPIRVTLLGEFSITVHGIKILDGRVGHRHAQSMLTYLLLQRRATARRQQIISQIWPECDYVVGSNRVYQATSALRAAIAEIDHTLDPFVLGRSTKSISVDMSMVSCDVEEMRACAREAVDGEDDAAVLQMARQVERLYAGDLYSPPADHSGFVALRREELRTLYVDAMVAGADAALRLERKRTASRFAANALAVDDMREDAVIALATALRADGRDVEADVQCRRYMRRLSQATGRAPSWRLLQVMRGATSECG